MCICPKKAILPSGTLKPNSSNLSTKRIQSNKITHSNSMSFYRNVTISVDIPLGTIQYIKTFSFYYKAIPTTFYQLEEWVEYASNYDDAIKNAAIYLTLLSNKRIPHNVIFPFFYKDNLVYSLGLLNGSITHYSVNPADAYYYAFIKKS